MEDWIAGIPPDGVREMCAWEHFCRVAREPERRKVGIDARVTIEGTSYEVEPNLAGETVVLLWGLFDNELYVEHEEERFGPYHPVSGPIPLNRYRSFKRGKDELLADRIRQLADVITLPIAVLAGENVRLTPTTTAPPIPKQPFDAKTREYHFSNYVAAKLAVADEIGRDLVDLSAEERAFIDQVLEETLVRRVILERVRAYFRKRPRGTGHAG